LLDKNSTLPLSCHPSELVTPTWLDTFDRVLVDAECSTDGALRHMVHKRERYSQPVYRNEKLTDPEKLQELVQLQKNLIMAGFQILRPGGRLVYSTCSLSSAQNEHVISWLLSQCPSAFLIPISFDLADKRMVDEGAIQGTVRFRPNITTLHGCSEDDLYGGGFFIAKLGKDIGK
jgi:16S rRNA C967 or C1407 C5-methylase (RsmB/RsmF family)